MPTGSRWISSCRICTVAALGAGGSIRGSTRRSTLFRGTRLLSIPGSTYRAQARSVVVLFADLNETSDVIDDPSARPGRSRSRDAGRCSNSGVSQWEKTRRRKTRNSGKLKRKEYEKELHKLQVELCHLQAWVKDKGARIILIFEGRDGAGKGGTIKAITERVSPRVFRVVALPAPSDREKTQMYIQRYAQHFPAAGEIVIFDRSWYNRLGVEHVMGFCTKEQYKRALELCPVFEKYLVEGGIS